MASSSVSPSDFKILLVGDRGVGKTTLLHRHLTGLFNSGYTATSGVEVRSMHFNTNYGDITLNIYDVGAVGKGGFEQVCGGADGLFLMFDVMKQTSYNNLGKWKQDVSKVAGVLQLLFVATKLTGKVLL
jgi:GTPase SAR1 family protein